MPTSAISSILLVLIAQLKGNRRKIGSGSASPLPALNRSDSCERSQAKQGEIKFPISQTQKSRAQRKINEGEINFSSLPPSRKVLATNYEENVLLCNYADSRLSPLSTIAQRRRCRINRSASERKSVSKRANLAIFATSTAAVVFPTFDMPRTRLSGAQRAEMRS